MLRSLSYRNFRLFFTGQSISLIGTWMQQVAMSWLVFQLTGSSFKLGLVLFCGQIPALFLSPLAGVMLDHWNRHRILLLTQTLAMLQAFALAALALT
ncbi:MAG: MFS transporter, partial [Alphaproteobacteria bacterium]|nr:MFS transporter [Alphaproteobacteria bacterium]